MYDALAQHAAASRLPPRPLMAFWRFWEQLAAQQAAQQAAQLAAGGDSPASPTCASLALGREGEWDALALLLHMLAEGAAGAGGGQQQLAALDATGTAIPAVLAYSAAQGADAAVQYAAARASALLAQLPANLPQMLDAVLRECQQAAAVAAAQAVGGGRDGSPGLGAAAGGGGQAAGEAMRLLWELSHSPGTGGTLPRAVALMQQQGGLLLPGLEAALDPEHGRTAASRWLAAGLVACLTYEPPSGAGAAAAGGAAAADGMRRLLASGPAAGALQRLLALLEPDVASAHPQAAQAAALAVANLAAFRGLGQAQAGDRPFMPEPSGGMKAKLTGLTNRLLQRPSPPGTPAGPSPHASGDHAAHLPVSDGSGDYSAAVERAEQGAGEPRAALLQHGAVPKLLRLVLHCSAAAAAADASAAAAARAPAAPMLAQPTPLAAPTAAQQAQAAAAAAAESATAQRAVLAAVLQAINNLCADPVRWLAFSEGMSLRVAVAGAAGVCTLNCCARLPTPLPTPAPCTPRPVHAGRCEPPAAVVSPQCGNAPAPDRCTHGCHVGWPAAIHQPGARAPAAAHGERRTWAAPRAGLQPAAASAAPRRLPQPLSERQRILHLPCTLTLVGWLR